jgi:hypothetical protein
MCNQLKMRLLISALLTFAIHLAGATSFIAACNQALNKSVIMDGFPPPVASRIYAYANIALYETCSSFDSTAKSLSGKLNGFSYPAIKPSPSINEELACVASFCFTAKRLVFTEKFLNDLLENKTAGLNLPDSVRNASLQYAQRISSVVIDWAKKDGYAEMRSLPRYAPAQEPGKWVPTPPLFAYAIEPYWSGIRPFTMDSLAQFKCGDANACDTVASSSFYQEALKVYQKSQTLTEHEKAIADYWNDNPTTTTFVNHLSVVAKGITPGGHWVHLASEVAEQRQLPVCQASYIATLTSIAVADGFISCWHEKFRANSIRPITFINLYIDKDWEPYIQTPPFPEYPSGHSVISAAAATVLDHFFVNDSHFTDTQEASPRSFDSFIQAAEEAGMSRFYGGIHFLQAIKDGQNQGVRIGDWVWGKIGYKR